MSSAPYQYTFCEWIGRFLWNLVCASYYQSIPLLYTDMVIMRMRIMGATPVLVVVVQDSEILSQYRVGEYEVFVKVLWIINEALELGIQHFVQI